MSLESNWAVPYTTAHTWSPVRWLRFGSLRSRNDCERVGARRRHRLRADGHPRQCCCRKSETHPVTPEQAQFQPVLSSADRGSGACPLYFRSNWLRAAARRFVPRGDICAAAKKICRYSIMSSTVASSVGGTVRPSAFAALRLVTNFELGRL